MTLNRVWPLFRVISLKVVNFGAKYVEPPEDNLQSVCDKNVGLAARFRFTTAEARFSANFPHN